MTNDPFFVVGTGRSGTTLFRNLLRHHPTIFIPRETHWLPILWAEFGASEVRTASIQATVDRVFMAKGRTPFERIMREDGLDGDEIRSSIRDRLGVTTTVAGFHRGLLELLAEQTRRTQTGDKTPDYGFFMATLLELFPESRFIHLVRDGRDVALSMSKVLSFRILAALELTRWWDVALDSEYRRGLDAADREMPPERFLELWLRRVRGIREEALKIPVDRYLEITYEDLLAAPVDVLRQVNAFLMLQGDESWIHEAAAMVRPGNLDRNRDNPVRTALGCRYPCELKAEGYSP